MLNVRRELAGWGSGTSSSTGIAALQECGLWRARAHAKKTHTVIMLESLKAEVTCRLRITATSWHQYLIVMSPEIWNRKKVVKLGV